MEYKKYSKERQDTKQKQNEYKQKTKSKMTDLNPTISITVLSENGIKIPIERQKLQRSR